MLAVTTSTELCLAHVPTGITGAVDFLVIAGGGGAGGGMAGGGGGGGILLTTTYGGTENPLSIKSGTSYTVTVGDGGSGGDGYPGTRAKGTAGGNSVFGSVTATGGGPGAGFNEYTPRKYKLFYCRWFSKSS